MPSTKDKSTLPVRSLLALPLLALASLSWAAPSRAAGDFTREAREIEALAEQMMQRARIPGMAMAIVADGEVVSLRGYGVVDSKLRDRVTPDTSFRIASLSKPFAGTLSAMLVREGAMDWDSPIVNQLPTFTLRDGQAAQKITVRQVLSHQVGLGYNTYDRDLEANQPYPLLAAKLAEAPLTCSPGECYAYQNIAFSLVGDMVFATTGDFYAAQVEKRIFQPLGMFGATFGRTGLEASPSWARPHVRSGGTWVPVRPKETYYRIPPAAGVNASARDMAQWLIAQMGHRPEVLPEELLEEIRTPQVETPGEIRGSGWRRDRLRKAHYALGWRIYDYAGHTLVYHAGAVQGYRAIIGFLPERDVGVVILWNSESAMPSGLFPSTMDRALALPKHDWMGLPRGRRR
ncbi:serine hydrolase domain-containing protein [Arenimonas sp.]|uniref:serine hydrolase domain-containing protein n=1 Tax=Arenimonas sp. TaxID=1872635 RepID=UPI0035B0E2CC